MSNKVRLTKKKNGPIVVNGPVEFTWDDGTVIETKPVFSLCGCGRSQKMPFCDGTHKISADE